MGRFDRNNSRRPQRGGFDRKKTEMYPAVCDACGKECKVPFKPSNDKPIYCSKCFEKRGNSHEGESSSRNSFGNSEQLDLIISKLDQIITALECKCEPCEYKSEVKKVVKKKTAKKTTKKAKKE